MNPPLFTEPLLFQQALDVRPFRGVGRTLQRLVEMCTCLVGNTKAHVQLAERAAGFESVWIERHCSVQLFQSAIDLIGPGVGDTEHGSYRNAFCTEREGLLQQTDRFFHTSAFKRTLGVGERLLSITNERGCWATGHTLTPWLLLTIEDTFAWFHQLNQGKHSQDSQPKND